MTHIDSFQSGGFQKSPLRLYGISKQVSWLQKKKPNISDQLLQSIGMVMMIEKKQYKNLEAVWP